MILGLALLVAAAHGDCASATAAAARTDLDAGAQIEALSDAMPGDSATVKVEAQFARGPGGDARALEILRAAVADGCRATSSTPARDTQQQVAAIIAGDPRFAGIRKGDDLFDRVLFKVGRWLTHLFESSGMRAYATSARVIYLAGLGIVIAFLAVRLVRQALSKRRRSDEKKAQAAVEIRRRRAFQSWRDEAARALANGDARAALRAGEAAILARVGELDDKAVTPARTHREIVDRLPPTIVGAVRPALAAFDRAYFSKDATVDDAQRFLADIDEAESHLRPSGV